eukprot:1442056-Pyramimonas_sp.AAC.1
MRERRRGEAPPSRQGRVAQLLRVLRLSHSQRLQGLPWSCLFSSQLLRASTMAPPASSTQSPDVAHVHR